MVFLLLRRQDAERDADDDGDDERDDGDEQRVGKTLRDHVERGHVEVIRHAEITLEDVQQIVSELHDNRIVEAELLPMASTLLTSY